MKIIFNFKKLYQQELVGMHINTTTMESSMEIPQRTKERTAV
jgi:hypothetical protein